MSDTGQKMAAIVAELSGQFLEREGVLRPIACALLARQHSLMVGPPGAAKSDLARAITGRVSGAVYWETMLTRATDPKQIFGPIDVQELMKGNYTQVFDGHATRAHIAFLDEIFRAEGLALDSLLPWLNERLYHPEQGGDPIGCPLISAVAASNSLPAEEETAALYDRLLVRVEVSYIRDTGNFTKLLRSAVAGRAASPGTTVALDALDRAVRHEVPAVAVPDGIMESVAGLRTALRLRDLVFSDRRWRQSVGLLQASAYLDGRDTVSDNDLDILRHVLWDSPVHRRAAEEQILALVNPDAREVFTFLEAISEVEAELDSMSGKSPKELAAWGSGEAREKMSMAKRKLTDMRAKSVKAGRSTDKIDEALGRQGAVMRRILTEALKMDPEFLAGASA